MIYLEIIIGITAVIAVILSVVNLWLMRIHSSPKPFLKLEYVHVGSHIPVIIIGTGSCEATDSNANTEQNFSPTVAMINVSKGIAVNVIVHANANTKAGESIKVRLEGPSVLIDSSLANDNKVIGKYDSVNKEVLLPEIMQVYVNYDSDSGYRRKTVWEYRSGHEGSIKLLKSS